MELGRKSLAQVLSSAERLFGTKDLGWGDQRDVGVIGPFPVPPEGRLVDEHISFVSLCEVVVEMDVVTLWLLLSRMRHAECYCYCYCY